MKTCFLYETEGYNTIPEIEIRSRVIDGSHIFEIQGCNQGVLFPEFGVCTKVSISKKCFSARHGTIFPCSRI